MKGFKSKRCKFCGAGCNMRIDISECLSCTPYLKRMERLTTDELTDADIRELRRIVKMAYRYHLRKQ